MRIVVFELEDWERAAFEPLCDEHDVQLLAEPLTQETAADYADADVVSTFIYSRLDRTVLEQMSQLKLIATRSTGYDHIDLEHCQENDVIVANVPSYGENTVAEHVFGLLLTISHQLDLAIDRTRKGDFSSRGLQGFDLEGKTLGVIGTGNIGRHTIRIAKGFGMEVRAYDVHPDEEAAQTLGFEYVDLDELFRQSDVISVHVPSTPQTHHLLSDEQFDRMKEGVVIINTSRGDVINNHALLRGLAEGKVRGAGLDVLPEEPIIREEAELLRSVYERTHNLDSLLADQVLIRVRSVVVTPHSAFNTREAVSRILRTTVANIESYVRGERQNVVNPEASRTPKHPQERDS
jgi:D-lactate dehydrogenase